MATVDRVLPGGGTSQRHRRGADARCSPSYRERHPKAPVGDDQPGLRDGQRGAPPPDAARSGESYINHPLAVARIVADIGLDEISLAAALLHDAVEDTEITLADVERDFGAEVAAIVDGVTKLERLQFDSKEAQQAATMRKMLVAMARDLRVLIIKLADRLHNMRTIAAMPSEKQRRIAQETLDIYAPLAHRLGMQELQAAARGPLASRRCTRSASPSSTTSSARARPSARSTSPRRSPRCAAGWPSSTSTPRSPAAASTCGASTRR